MINNISHWLDETANKLPNKVAFEDEKTSVTFKKFREHALVIATELVKREVFKSPIAVYMDKSVEEIETFLGVAYSGNFYSPIDVDMPGSRIEKIYEVLKPEIIITKTEYKNRIPLEYMNKIICLEEIRENNICEDIVYSQRKRCCDRDLLYVLFTSGSTGIPKGVTICHQSVVDYIDWLEKEFDFNSETIFGNQAPFYFDNSILDIYTTIKCGCCMNIIPKKLFSWAKILLEYIEEKHINTIFWVPSAMILVSKMKALTKVNLNGKLKKILFCGEVMPNKHLNVWRKCIPDAMYANLYGPTEITDVCCYYVVNRAFSDDEPLPIGNAMENTDIIILDENGTIPKKGDVGELCVRGTSLSLGYYGNFERTKQAFVQNPLNNNYIEYIYKTGDLVKVNEYGEILYVGRKDFQIKHMGHRIELGEIEMAISSIEGITMCCCLYDDKKEKIVVFIDEDMELKDLNEILKNMLPEYMLPNKLVHIAHMPLNLNGKIDRVKLKESL